MLHSGYTRIFAKSRNRVAGLLAANCRCFRVASEDRQQWFQPPSGFQIMTG
jgi:hypothetical protein